MSTDARRWNRAVGRALWPLLGMLATLPGNAAGPPDGKAVYERWCSHCHDGGRGRPGTESLQVKYGGKLPALLLERTDLTPQAVAGFVRQGVLLMAPYRKTEINDAELAALSQYVATRQREKP
jgi:(+)-pinoresinol hydroxylase